MEEFKELTSTILDMAMRIRELREVAGFSVADMARSTGVTEEEYLDCETGKKDISFAFIFRCALAFGVDVTDIISGSSPKLRKYTVTRKGQGREIQKAHGMVYYSLAPEFKNRISEPLLVNILYNESALYAPIELTTHFGQELDIVVSGKMKIQIGNHTEILEEGDSIYYDSSTPHGMIAMDGKDCVFYAIVLNPENMHLEDETSIVADTAPKDDKQDRIYRQFIKSTKDEQGRIVDLEYMNTDTFNFAFDVVDALGRKKPEKLAMLHLDSEKNERRFTFKDMKDYSSQCANYFKSLGIKRGDKVMVVLKRHYQFWFAMLGLHKLGAIAIPATSQLLKKDFEYRFKAAGVSAIICTPDRLTAIEADAAIESTGMDIIKIMVNEEREGWHNFDIEFKLFSRRFVREDDAPAGDDTMLMIFTSGTTGYPKIATHSYKYPLGHFVTAKHWHCVDPDGLHLTISDTGWAKALWGKIYGQWLCEGAIFAYDFNKFKAQDILPLFAEHHITTFCAPPTMYRMLMKEDLAQYDLSSIQRAAIAGEAMNPEVFNQIEKRSGIKVMEGFGQTETTLAIGNLRGYPHKIGSMGRPVPPYDIHLVDADEKDVPVGEPGEIVINTANGAPCGLFKGYYNGEQVERWQGDYYHTGDMAWKDEDGYYWYIGRIDDVIKSSGYRIGPFEIESVLMELPYILECGVTGVPDETRGQLVKATIVLTKGTAATDELKLEIQQYVKHRTAAYKYPKIVEFRDELPKTISGKIIRNLL